jgi:glutamate-5-semialdehyde dehydrogenase
MKTVSPVLAATPAGVRNAALIAVAEALKAHAEEIFAANRRDLAAADAAGVAPAVKKRLLYSEAKMQDSVAGLYQLASLPDPLGRVTLNRELDEGLRLTRVTCPIGVIGVIFGARPDALVQISTLCLKSGNCAILKGGKETAQTNRVLFSIIRDAAVSSGLPASCLLQAELHNEIDELLQCEKEVDLLIPRGSNQFVQYIMNNTKIPVMGHADGICHIYVDRDADQEMAVQVILDAKTQYTAACNAVETVLVHRDIAPSFLPKLARALHSASVRLRGTQEAEDLIVGSVEAAAAIDAVDIMTDEDFRTEYLDLILSVKVVADVEEAIDHINRYGSHHTDSIITRDDAAADRFLQMVDSAGVYRNCSTRFADGFRYGFGAEVGISTSKLHARGPVGLEGLVTYKYLLRGEGQIVGDYASGRSSFHFRDLM